MAISLNGHKALQKLRKKQLGVTEEGNKKRLDENENSANSFVLVLPTRVRHPHF